MAGHTALLGGLLVVVGAVTMTPPPAPMVDGGASSVRACDFVPGRSAVAWTPPDVAEAALRRPAPTLPPPSSSGPDTAVVERQGAILDALAQAVRDHYLHPERTGASWDAVTAAARAHIASGLDEAAFRALLGWAVHQLDDDHSYVLGPDDVAEAMGLLAGAVDYVGIGLWSIPLGSADHEVVVAVLPGGPAAGAGLRPRDAILAVDGGPVLDEVGQSLVRGPVGTPVTLTIRSPGEAARDITIVRREVSGGFPIDSCVVPGTRIGYLFLPTLGDGTVDDQVREALEAMTADGPLTGLILDGRVNDGGWAEVLLPILDLFAVGEPGAWLGRDWREPLLLEPVDIGGSQTVPLVALIGPQTNSFGEILAGVLGHVDRATLVGASTRANMEILVPLDLPHGWMVMLATGAFQPVGADLGVWDVTGIVPDVHVPTLWHQTSEATDPALATAVELLAGP
ncbi:MAG: PDZ domain-containing protein [Chloroflexi bacterium]|nr:PDZ domain-containing protein [Chloroflexota bacterium]